MERRIEGKGERGVYVLCCMFSILRHVRLLLEMLLDWLATAAGLLWSLEYSVLQ